MVIRTGWPGASAQEVELQVTDKLEKTTGSAVSGLFAQLFPCRRIPNFFDCQGFRTCKRSAGHLVSGT